MPDRIRWRGDVDSIETESTTTRLSDEYERSSHDSNRSYSTAHTAYSTPKPVLQRHDTCFGRVESHRSGVLSHDWDNPRTSVETYASTEASDLDDEDGSQAAYDVLDFEEDHYQSDAIPATPRDFAELFPSSRRLSIHHDDSTIDGNMNLRVDTLVETEWSSRKQNLTLFHLKMNDLKSREFSLRRYCRDSGREVCKSIRKYQVPARKQRPALTKSFSSALAHMKGHHDESGPHMRHLQRNDSGFDASFGPAHDDRDENDDDDVRSANLEASKMGHVKKRLPTNTIKFEFSNYANVELKRRGAGAHKVYQFEYWGHHYTWKRTVKPGATSEEVSFHLLRSDKLAPLARIVPVPLTNEQAQEERLKGGWIPPCSMWITDAELLNGSPDAADLVVASGLVALVDDAIKRRWHSTTHRQVLLPLIRGNSFRLNMEYIGPKRLIDEAFNRRPVSRSSTMQHV